MNDDSQWADEILRRVRASANPKPSQQTRVLAGLEKQLATPPASTPEGPEAGPGAEAGRLQLSTLAKLGLGAAFGGAMGALGYWWGWNSHAASVELATAPLVTAAPVVEQSVPAAAVTEQSVPAAAVTERSVPAAPAAAPPLPTELASVAPPAPSTAHPAQSPRAPHRKEGAGRARQVEAGPKSITLRDAIDQLQHAQTALRRGEAERALQIISDLDQVAPASMLQEERLASRALALCELGDLSAARKALTQLNGDETRSIYRARLEAHCGPSLYQGAND